MLSNHFGELAALLTAVFWTITAMSFEAAGKRVGALSLNLIRLFIGFAFLTIYTYISRGILLPLDATSEQWFWLLLSGVIGFVLGDLFLFQAFILIGARISMLIMSLVPPLTAIIGWIALGEVLSVKEFLGMGITMSGIAMVMFLRKKPRANKSKKSFKLSVTLTGVLLAFGGAVGQAAGLVLSKKGMGDYDAFAATQIRIIAGMVGFTIVITVMRRWGMVMQGLRNVTALKFMTLGSFFGPFLGVSFSLLAVQYTETGIAATIMSIVPVLIIAPSVLIKKEKINAWEVIGALLSVVGVATFFL